MIASCSELGGFPAIDAQASRNSSRVIHSPFPRCARSQTLSSQRSIGSLQSPDVGTGYSPPSISAFLDERKRNHEKRAKWAKFTFQAASRNLEWIPLYACSTCYSAPGELT